MTVRAENYLLNLGTYRVNVLSHIVKLNILLTFLIKMQYGLNVPGITFTPYTSRICDSYISFKNIERLVHLLSLTFSRKVAGFHSRQACVIYDLSL